MEYIEISTSVPGEGICMEDWDDEFCGCDCETECTSESNCSCLLGQNNYTSDGRVLSSKSKSEKPILECHSQCACSLLADSCQNRVLQNGVKKKLLVFETSEKGYGVKAGEDMKQGTFVCEYAGEVIGEEEVKRRHERHKNEDNYTLTLKEHFGGKVNKTFIDPRIRGNVGRFLNHSCQPNCDVAIVRVGRMIPKVGLFANRDIETGEELCYDYGESALTTDDNDDKRRKLCHCGAKNCRKYLPMSATPIE